MRYMDYIYRTVRIVLGLCVVLCIVSGCKWGDYYVVDFDTLPEGDKTMFRVTAERVTDLSQGVPEDCYLPHGIPYNQWKDDDAPKVRKTSGISAAGLAQTLLDKMNAGVVKEITGTYMSYDTNGDLITLSGKVLLPASGKFDRYILVSHYTIGSDKEAPSNCFPLEGILCSMGYAVICPDYIGYGVTADKVHPYLVMELTSWNVLDMYYAVNRYFAYVGLQPKYPDIYLMGYSQGGATTMAVEYLIEQLNSIGASELYVPIRRVFAGGGPYDVKATYDRFVMTNTADYPVAVPLVLQGMIEGNGLDLDMHSIMQPWLCDKMDEWINSKRYTTAELNALIGTKQTDKMLTPTGMNTQSKEVSELYKAMVSNSIVSYAWTPQAPVYIMHSMDDETVTYLNATNAKQKWASSNIQYNFGHYGGHVKTCIRFLLTVSTLLEQDQKDEKAKYLN